ncbi:MAG: hypothetical protein ACUVS7_12490 [Bryobacteraceae bacterium]
MNRIFWMSIAVTAILMAGGCRKEPAGGAQAQQQLEEAQKKLAEAEQQAAEARRQLEEAEQRAAQAEQQRQLDEARQKLEQAQKQAAEARRQLDQARQKTAQGQPASPAQPAAGKDSGGASPAVSSVAPPAPAPKPITVAAGTPVVIRTIATLSTKDARDGEVFRATLAEPLVVDGVTIAAKGAEVEGVVVQSDPGGRVKGVAQLGVALRSIHTAAGKVDIQTGTYVTEAKSSVKKDVTRGAIMTGVGAAIGAIAGGGKGAAVGAGVGAGAGTATAMATRGEPAVIPAESVLTFRLQQPVTVTVK